MVGRGIFSPFFFPNLTRYCALRGSCVPLFSSVYDGVAMVRLFCFDVSLLFDARVQSVPALALNCFT